MSLVVSSLRARLAMLGGARRRQASRLIERLEDSAPGNPAKRFSWESTADLEGRVATRSPAP